MYRNRIGVAGVDPVSKPLEKTMRLRTDLAGVGAHFVSLEGNSL